MCCGDKCPGCPDVPENTELIECREQLLRVTADLQNFQRRVERERLEWAVMGQIEAVRSMLVVVDDLALAVAAGGDNAWVAGLKLIGEKAVAVLKGLGVEEIAGQGMFDPELHEAVTMVAVEGKEAGTIVEVLRRGYTMKGRVVRHAQVSVAK